MIRTIRIQGFKSISDQTLGLGRVNCFIGANGVGKSNILEAVGILGAAANGRVDDESIARRGVRQGLPRLYKTSFEAGRIPPHITIEATADSGACFRVSLLNPLEKPEPAWSFKTETLSDGASELVSRGVRGDDPTLPGFDLFVIHVDADVAENSYSDGGPAVENDAGGLAPLPCSQPCPPPAGAADELRKCVLAWLGLVQVGPRTVLCVPSKAIEAWLAAGVLDGSHALLSGLECNLAVEGRLAALPKARRIRKKAPRVPDACSGRDEQLGGRFREVHASRALWSRGLRRVWSHDLLMTPKLTQLVAKGEVSTALGPLSRSDLSRATGQLNAILKAPLERRVIEHALPGTRASGDVSARPAAPPMQRSTSRSPARAG